MKHVIELTLIAACVLATASTAARPARASAGCSEFHGLADDQTKGEGGSRVGHGFSKGDTLTVTIQEDPHQVRYTANLLQYTSPDGPSHALVEDTHDGFTYTVPANTGDFIYLNFGGPWPGMIVIWGCKAAKE
jgi:hypothetical protein